MTGEQPSEATALDGAMHSVWLHGKWRWLTRNMTTEQREAAWASVKRYSAGMGDPTDEPLSEGWAWWRDDAPQDVWLSPTSGPEDRACPVCRVICCYDGWDHVHPSGLGIGSCPLPTSGPEVQR